jgi:hypothetical protein
MNRDDLEAYVMGIYEGDAAALERELADDPAARAIVAEEARLDMLLRDAGAAAGFCPACDDLVRGARCDACGAAIKPGGYTVDRVLVSNAHGRMYAARDVDGKQVALKELAFIQSPSAGALAAFEREAKFLRALEHPAIPRFCASFQEGDGVHARYYLAQELVAGEALLDRLEAHWFTEAEILGIARQVLDVLVYLQDLTPLVIHRDIKPANLLARPDGAIAVVDFGAAHVQGMTAGTTAIGTFGYMPIEQHAGVVDATTDLYGLGASLIHLLTRREPWQILQDGLLADVVLNVSRPVRGFLAKLVAPNPRDRFRSAKDARAALDKLGRGSSAVVKLPNAPAPAKPARPRRRWLRELALAASVLAGVGGFATLAKQRKHRADERWLIEMIDRADRDRDRDDNRGRGPRPDRRDPERLRRAGRAVSEFSALADDMCRCSDRRCVEVVAARVGAWSRDIAPSANWMDPEVAKQITALSSWMAGCGSRHAAGDGAELLLHSLRDPETAENVAVFTPEPAEAQAEDGKVVHLPLSSTLVTAARDAASAIAQSCGVNLVMSGQIARELSGKLSRVRCDRALDELLRSTDLGYEIHGGIVRIAARDDFARERTARDDRARRGIADDALPRGRAIDLDLKQAQVRDVVAMLADAGAVSIALGPRDLPDRTVTVHLTQVAWDRALREVLAASGLGYRYHDADHRLRVAPIAEIDAERAGASPHGLLEIRCAADTVVTIDGAITAIAAGKPVELSPGTHSVTLAGRSGKRESFLVDIAEGSTVRIGE